MVTYNQEKKVYEWQTAIPLPQEMVGEERTVEKAIEKAKTVISEAYAFHGITT